MQKSNTKCLFGGDQAWLPEDWTASDDRVRGGQSQSYFDATGPTGRFHGTLDITTLGGAGFASQRTTGEARHWDLSTYAGIVLDLVETDSKRYTFILKDELLPKNPDGREQATVSYEYDFEAEPKPGSEKHSIVFIPWNKFKPTYRGKDKPDAEPLNTQTIKRMSFMMRSFFGAQEGPFSLSVHSIEAVSAKPSQIHAAYEKSGNEPDLEKALVAGQGRHERFKLPYPPLTICAAALLTFAGLYLGHRKYLARR